MKRRVLFLPVEVKPREFLGKLLLAARAAERGWQVRIGRDKEVRASASGGPGGAIMEINLPGAPRLEEHRRNGLEIAALDEESIVYYGGRDYVRRKVNRDGLKGVHSLLVVGEGNAADLRRYCPESEPKIAITGNPRFDTLLPELRSVYRQKADAIRRRHGNFLLVNTNFGPVNHVKRTSEELLAELQRNNLVEDAAHAAMLKRWHDYKRWQFGALKPVLADIARAGRFDSIVVRPHPTENHATWQEWAAPLGIAVAFEDNANVWMLASTAFLHTGCTTAIEATLLDLPVTSFVPEPGHEMLNQADAVSAQVASAEEFLALLGEAAGPGFDRRIAEQRAKVAGIVANSHPPMAVDRILDTLDGLDLPEVPVASARMNPLVAAAHHIHALTRRRDSYAYRKFGGLEVQELIEPLTHWRDAGILKRLPDLKREADGTWLVS